MACCSALMGSSQKPLPGPGARERLVWRRARRVHPGHVQPDELVELVDASARTLPRGLEAGRDRHPPALLPADMFGTEQALAVLLRQRGRELGARCDMVL